MNGLHKTYKNAVIAKNNYTILSYSIEHHHWVSSFSLLITTICSLINNNYTEESIRKQWITKLPLVKIIIANALCILWRRNHFYTLNELFHLPFTRLEGHLLSSFYRWKNWALTRLNYMLRSQNYHVMDVGFKSRKYGSRLYTLQYFAIVYLMWVYRQKWKY